MSEGMSFMTVMQSAAKLPIVRIDRAEFLQKNLGKLCSQPQVQAAIVDGTLKAGIDIDILDSVADTVVSAEALKVTAISMAAGIPGGFAMAATMPADIIQFYGFIMRVAQQFAYIYGWLDILSEDRLDSGTEAYIISFIGVMSGVSVANIVVAKLFGETAAKSVAKKVAAKALTKTSYYPIIKSIAKVLGVNMTKATFSKGVSKAVPFIGGAISGGLTWVTFKPMANRLKNYLSSLARMSPTEFTVYEKSLPSEIEPLIPEADDI